MYSPPMPRTAEAIFAKFSLPKNILGLMVMYSSLSAKSSLASSSSGKDMRMSSIERCLELVGVGGGGAWTAAFGVGCAVCSPVRVLMAAWIDRNSSEALFIVTKSASTLLNSWFSFSLSLLTLTFLKLPKIAKPPNNYLLLQPACSLTWFLAVVWDGI